MKYQIQYKIGSVVSVGIYEAISFDKVIFLFRKLSEAEELEVREIKYSDKTYPKDDGNYASNLSVFLVGDNDSSYSFKIPKLKKNISRENILSLIKKHIKISGKIAKKIKTKSYFDSIVIFVDFNRFSPP